MGATEQITGIIPVVIAGGVAVKMTESMFPKQKATRRRRVTKRKKSRK